MRGRQRRRGAKRQTKSRKSDKEKKKIGGIFTGQKTPADVSTGEEVCEKLKYSSKKYQLGKRGQKSHGSNPKRCAQDIDAQKTVVFQGDWTEKKKIPRGGDTKQMYKPGKKM